MRRYVTLALGVVFACGTPRGGTVATHADLILENGHIFTGDRERPWATALAIGGESIIALDDDAKGLTAPRRIDLGGKLVIPGLVDCHTHLAFGGWRADEFSERCRGATYAEIAAKGGGIAKTVRLTRAATEDDLQARSRGFLAEMLRLGVTTVYVTHDQSEAMTLGHRVAVLRDGRLQQCAPPQELYDRPANAFVAGFIGSPAMSLLEVPLHRNGSVELAGIHVPCPADASAAAAARHDDRLAFAFDHEVVRQIHTLPRGVVSCRLLAAGHLSRLEPPVEVEQLPFAHFRQGRRTNRLPDAAEQSESEQWDENHRAGETGGHGSF